MRYDDHVLHVLRRAGADPYLAAAARGLSRAGEHGAVWIAAGLAAAGADRARRQAWLRATALVVGAHLAGSAVKRVVRRPRPVLRGVAPLVHAPGRHGFPSSHAASSAAAAVAFGAVLCRAGRAAPGPPGSHAAHAAHGAPVFHGAPAAALVVPLAAAVCLSRVVAGVHYPSDVACGVLLGGGLARLGRDWTLAAPTTSPTDPPVNPPVTSQTALRLAAAVATLAGPHRSPATAADAAAVRGLGAVRLGAAGAAGGVGDG